MVPGLVRFTCKSPGQADGGGMGAGAAVGAQQATEDGVRDEVERVARYVPQHHGPGPPVQPLEALAPQDAAHTVDGPPIDTLVGHAHRPQLDVPAPCRVPRQLEVRWTTGEGRKGNRHVLFL